MITLFYLSINALFFIFLSALVIRARLKNQVPLGDGGNKVVLKAIRIHGNAANTFKINQTMSQNSLKPGIYLANIMANGQTSRIVFTVK